MLNFNAIKIYKLSNKLYKRNYKRLSYMVDKINLILRNSSIPGSCEIGENTRIAYGGIGVVIHAEAKIGKNCMIGQGITLGKQLGKVGVPEIEDNVYIAAGVRIIGKIKIGHDSIIAPNSVVIKDVEPYSIYSGIPARKINSITKTNIEKYRVYGIQNYEE
jgi:serine O-acetyltransferase